MLAFLYINNMRPLYLFLSLGVTLSILFSSGQIENPDTHLRLTQARLVVDSGMFSLPKDVGEESHGNIAINKEGKRFMVYNPGQTIIFIPIYFLAKIIAFDEVNAYYYSAFIVSFLNYLIHALCAYLLFKIALFIGAQKKQAYLVSIIFALTSYSFVFAQSTYEHHFEMFFVLLSTYYALGNGRYSGFLSGLFLSIGLVFRTTTILAVPAILLIQRNNVERLKSLSTLALGIAFVFFYNYYRFGNALESGYSIAWSLAHMGRFKYWSLSTVPQALFGFFFSPGKGLLFFSTTFLLSFFVWRTFIKRHKLISLYILFISVAYVGLFSLNFAWHGSIWSYGPRYILPILPFFYLPIIYIKVRGYVLVSLLIAFIFQFELITVNYKRDVLSDYIKYNGLSDLKYIGSINKEPHLIQAKQLKVILPKNLERLNNYMPNSPWKKEIRTASNIDVLNSSIEKNSINFWWIRVIHFNPSFLTYSIVSFILFLGLIQFLVLIKYVKKEII